LNHIFHIVYLNEWIFISSVLKIQDEILEYNNKSMKKTQHQSSADIKKNATRNSYEQTTDAYIAHTSSLHPEKYGKKFTSLLPEKGHILDLGCGPGRDAKVFADQGFHVVGIDFSPAMIEAARACAPHATFHVMDIESINFPPNSFDGVWANCSLLHVPKRSIPAVLRNIAALLKSKVSSISHSNWEMLAKYWKKILVITERKSFGPISNRKNLLACSPMPGSQ
jgi:ubiquinone/menaquinone biosynthesis C-methylase UbiE